MGTAAISDLACLWRPYLLGVTGLLLGAGILLAYRDRKKACAPGSLCATRPVSRWNVIVLGTLTALIAGLAAFPYYSGAVAQAVVGKPTPTRTVKPAALATVTFRVPEPYDLRTIRFEFPRPVPKKGCRCPS